MTSITQLSWASLAVQPVPPDTYQPVRRKVIDAGNSSSKLASAYKKDRLWHVLIAWLDRDTTVELVNEHLEMNEIQVSWVSELTPREERQKNSAAFRVSFNNSTKDAIFDPLLWLSKIEIRDWCFKSADNS